LGGGRPSEQSSSEGDDSPDPDFDKEMPSEEEAPVEEDIHVECIDPSLLGADDDESDEFVVQEEADVQAQMSQM
jgi:hypothetical protein